MKKNASMGLEPTITWYLALLSTIWATVSFWNIVMLSSAERYSLFRLDFWCLSNSWNGMHYLSKFCKRINFDLQLRIPSCFYLSDSMWNFTWVSIWIFSTGVLWVLSAGIYIYTYRVCGRVGDCEGASIFAPWKSGK